MDGRPESSKVPSSYQTPGTVIPIERNSTEVHAARKRTKKEQLLALLWDMEPHSTSKLVALIGHRFGASIGKLRREGWSIETKEIERAAGQCTYRLTSQQSQGKRAGRIRMYLSPHAVEQLAGGVVTREVVEQAEQILSK